jgi:hypothetical protein
VRRRTPDVILQWQSVSANQQFENHHPGSEPPRAHASPGLIQKGRNISCFDPWVGSFALCFQWWPVLAAGHGTDTPSLECCLMACLNFKATYGVPDFPGHWPPLLHTAVTSPQWDGSRVRDYVVQIATGKIRLTQRTNNYEVSFKIYRLG